MNLRARGFGIPYILALVVVVGAAVSCSSTKDVDVTPTARLTVDAHVGKSLTADSTTVSDLSSNFLPNETVFVVVDVPGRKDGMVRARWMFGTETVSEQTMPIMDGINRYRFRLEPPEGGLRTGQYRLEIYVNDDLSDTETFEVRSA